MTYRAYYNREADFPQVWSIDEGDISSEINVLGFQLGHGVRAWSERVPDFTAINAEREPKVWLSIEAAAMTLRQGVAVFHNTNQHV